jgi:hypothetical protein
MSSVVPLVSASMDLMHLGLAICRLIKQPRGLFADARASRAESVETLVFAKAFPEWPELRAAGTR